MENALVFDRKSWSYITECEQVNFNECDFLTTRHKIRRPISLNWDSILFYYWFLPGQRGMRWSTWRIWKWIQLRNCLFIIGDTENSLSSFGATKNAPIVSLKSNNLGIKLKCIRRWSSSFGNLINVKYPFFAITLRSTLIWSGGTCLNIK